MLGVHLYFVTYSYFVKNILHQRNICLRQIYKKKLLNPFQVSAPLLYPLKTSENLWFSDILVGIEIEQWMK